MATLSSDPPLSTVGILGLLAGLDESQVEDAQQVQGRVDKMAGQGAATLAAGRSRLSPHEDVERALDAKRRQLGG